MQQDHTSIFVRKAVAGDMEGAQWLVRHFQPFVAAQVRLRLRGHGTSEDVEDLAADVWVVTLSKLSNLEARDGRLAPVLVTFLGTTVMQTCNNFLRRRARQATQGGTAAQEPSAERPGVSQVPAETMGVVTRAVQRDLSSAVGKCLDALTQDKRDVLVLRLMEHRSNQEIAKLLGIPANTVAVRYRRALDELRNGLPADVFDDIASAAP